MNRKIYRQTAKRHKVSVREVKKDMQAAVDEAYKNPTLLAQSVPKKGSQPTVEEVVDYLAERVKEKIE